MHEEDSQSRICPGGRASNPITSHKSDGKALASQVGQRRVERAVGVLSGEVDQLSGCRWRRSQMEGSEGANWILTAERMRGDNRTRRKSGVCCEDWRRFLLYV